MCVCVCALVCWIFKRNYIFDILVVSILPIWIWHAIRCSHFTRALMTTTATAETANTMRQMCKWSSNSYIIPVDLFSAMVSFEFVQHVQKPPLPSVVRQCECSPPQRAKSVENICLFALFSAHIYTVYNITPCVCVRRVCWVSRMQGLCGNFGNDANRITFMSIALTINLWIHRGKRPILGINFSTNNSIIGRLFVFCRMERQALANDMACCIESAYECCVVVCMSSAYGKLINRHRMEHSTASRVTFSWIYFAFSLSNFLRTPPDAAVWGCFDVWHCAKSKLARASCWATWIHWCMPLCIRITCCRYGCQVWKPANLSKGT